jgi:hypothetical protein
MLEIGKYRRSVPPLIWDAQSTVVTQRRIRMTCSIPASIWSDYIATDDSLELRIIRAELYSQARLRLAAKPNDSQAWQAASSRSVEWQAERILDERKAGRNAAVKLSPETVRVLDAIRWRDACPVPACQPSTWITQWRFGLSPEIRHEPDQSAGVALVNGGGYDMKTMAIGFAASLTSGSPL